MASRSKWARLEALLRNRGFAMEYASARERWRDGAAAAFPAGTWNEDSGRTNWASFGSPLDSMYQQRYNNMISAVAAHIKTRADWYRALAYIKPSGANHVSAENRLPNGCKFEFGGSSCNAMY